MLKKLKILLFQKLEICINQNLNILASKEALEKQIMLQVLDVHWKEHLAEMDHLRQSVGLRAYAQKILKMNIKGSF